MTKAKCNSRWKAHAEHESLQARLRLLPEAEHLHLPYFRVPIMSESVPFVKATACGNDFLLMTKARACGRPGLVDQEDLRPALWRRRRRRGMAFSKDDRLYCNSSAECGWIPGGNIWQRYALRCCVAGGSEWSAGTQNLNGCRNRTCSMVSGTDKNFQIQDRYGGAEVGANYLCDLPVEKLEEPPTRWAPTLCDVRG